MIGFGVVLCFFFFALQLGEVVSFKRIIPEIPGFTGPSSLPYALKNPNKKRWAQDLKRAMCTDACALKLFGMTKKKDLFFVESGAYDGEEHSNTLALEKYGNWSGLLIEPNPHLYRSIVALNRKCYAINAGLSTNNAVGFFPFVLAGPLGGFNHTFSSKHRKRMDGEVRSVKPWMNGKHGSGRVIKVPTYPLETMLKAVGKTDLVVDFWTLDTEGSEPGILAAVDWSRVTVGLLVVEHNDDSEMKDGIISALKGSGMVQASQGRGQDFEFYNPKYFTELGISNPAELIRMLGTNAEE